MFDMITKGQVEKYLTREDNLCQNQPKAFSMIMQDFCTHDMVRREIQTHPDFKSKIEDDPFELLKVVKTLMHNPTRAHYPFLQLTDIALNFLLCRQYENEHPADFKKRLEEKADIFVSLVGNNILDEFIKTTPAHKQASSVTKEQLCKKTMDQWIALIAIRNLEPTKYSILKHNLNDDYFMGVDKFPTDLDSAVDILINHNKVFKRPRPPPGKPPPAPKSKTTEDDILAQEGTTTSFAQCFKCGSHDHPGPD
jgi:hypothetical protein